MKRVLSWYGGGVRGALSTTVGTELEGRLELPLGECADLIVGTSTGGIIALGLANGLTAQDIQKFFVERAAEAFKTSPIRRIRQFSTFLSPATKFDPKYLEAELSLVFGSNSVTRVKVPAAVTAYDLKKREPVIIRSWEDMESMVGAAMATSAAPTYFPPWGTLWDGGVWANDPCLVALEMARELWPSEEFVLISFGTGQVTRPIDPKKAKSLTQVLPIIFDVMMDGQQDGAHRFLSAGNIPDLAYYHRFQGELLTASDDMDNVSPENIGKLVEEGQRIFNEDSKAVAEIVSLLSRSTS